jgi:MoaA/NifB/PqqE/SkfB family radical SAM enzyme
MGASLPVDRRFERDPLPLRGFALQATEPRMDARRSAQRAARAIGRGVTGLTGPRVASNALVRLNVRTDWTFALPILLYAPTARCNSRCVSCDWWRSDGAGDLRRDQVAALARELPGLGTKLVVFTGGEPLVREDVFDLADLFRGEGVVLHLLTSGLALERHAAAVADRFAAVTISLDGHTPDLYRRVRGVDGLQAVERGVRRLRELRPDLPVRARSTLHQRNFRALPDLIDKARAMGLEQISFLAADSSSDAFGRKGPTLTPNPHGLLLDATEASEFERIVDKALVSHARAFRERFVAEREDRLRDLARYYRAHLRSEPFPAVRCDAPWASAVVEADGTVRPCFFQPPIGNVRDKPLRGLLDDEMVRARRELDVAHNPTCQRCVCSLRVGLRSRLW